MEEEEGLGFGDSSGEEGEKDTADGKHLFPFYPGRDRPLEGRVEASSSPSTTSVLICFLAQLALHARGDHKQPCKQNAIRTLDFLADLSSCCSYLINTHPEQSKLPTYSAAAFIPQKHYLAKDFFSFKAHLLFSLYPQCHLHQCCTVPLPRVPWAH